MERHGVGVVGMAYDLMSASSCLGFGFFAGVVCLPERVPTIAKNSCESWAESYGGRPEGRIDLRINCFCLLRTSAGPKCPEWRRSHAALGVTATGRTVAGELLARRRPEYSEVDVCAHYTRHGQPFEPRVEPPVWPSPSTLPYARARRFTGVVAPSS